MEDKYELTAHKCNKYGTTWVYNCKYRLTQKVLCPASAQVVYSEEKWILSSGTDNHLCEPNRPRVIAESLRCKMKELVRNDPAKPVGIAVRKVREEAFETYADEDDFYDHLVYQLGSDAALEKQLLRTRYEIIGQTPKSRNAFAPEEFLGRIYGEGNKVIVCDSNNLEDGWRDKINKRNGESDYDWDKLDDEMLSFEETHVEHEEIEASEAEENIGTGFENVIDRDLPKRVLAYTSENLLKMLGKGHKTSVDGTFKSSCKLWAQQFIWMVKAKGYWIPVVWGWLPDKTEEIYKVFFHLVQKKMEDLGININIESVLCDFELNIMKSIDVMLKVPILGCFFHLKQCFQRKVSKNGFKSLYENDEFFNSFINQCSAISALPLEDIEEGLNHVERKFVFEDERTDAFKKSFLAYIRNFWIFGCLPPRVWNTFGRSEDITNNNQVSHCLNFATF